LTIIKQTRNEKLKERRKDREKTEKIYEGKGEDGKRENRIRND